VYEPVKGFYNKLHNAWIRENAGKALAIAHIPMLMATAFLRGATPENIVAGFKATGICPYDSDIFNDSHFISLGVSEENAAAFTIETEYNKGEQRIVVDSAHIEIAAHVSTSESSISGMSCSDKKRHIRMTTKANSCEK